MKKIKLLHLSGLRNMSVYWKIHLLIIAGFFSTFCIAAVGLSFLNTMKNNSVEMYEQRTLPVQWLNVMRANLGVIKGAANEMVVTPLHKRQEELALTIESISKENDKLFALYKRTSLDATAKRDAENFEATLKRYEDVRGQAQQLAMAGKVTEAARLMQDQVEPYYKSTERLLIVLVNHNTDIAEHLNKKNEQSAKQAMLYVFLIAIVTGGVVVMLGSIISRLIVKPLNAMGRLMEDAERGDLTVVGTYEAKDEIGQLNASFNSMVTGFRTLIKQLLETSQSLLTESGNLSNIAEENRDAAVSVTKNIDQIASAAEMTLVQTEEASQAVQGLAADVSHIAERSKTMSEVSDRTSLRTKDGHDIVSTVVLKMTDTASTVGQSAVLVQNLQERSRSIESIVTVITGIASQTNLLALNASIEAARAGQNGRGFAVVASEIRNLAEQTALSTKKITQLIQSIQIELTQSVQAMSMINTEVQAAVDGVRQIGSVFTDILESINDVNEQTKAVAAAFWKISVGSDQVASSSAEVAAVSKEITMSIQDAAVVANRQIASVEEIFQASQYLQNVSYELQETVKQFKLT